ncbi:MAG: hypothetical protein ACI4XD_04095 [Clostridia bacterium]
MKVTLQVNGREMTFSKEELIAIVEHLSTQQTTTTKVAQKPTEDAWFEVKPQTIDQKLFEKKRNDYRQEAMRKMILEAFAEMKENPEKYGKNFKTMMPRRTWPSKTVTQLKEMAEHIGDHNADWVEQALEWAQRIANGESWKGICNAEDTANCYRLVVWKNGYARLVGGSVFFDNIYDPASDVCSSDYEDYYYLHRTVPLVVLYE